MTRDNRVRESLLEGMRDFQNLLVHIQTVLAECALPVVRAGGGLTFSGFSIQVTPSAPVDWIGYHIDRPGTLLYEIQDRILPDPCPLSNVTPLQPRRYERTFALDTPFFHLDERQQMDVLKAFLLETTQYLQTLNPDEEGPAVRPLIPIC